jgi:transcription elongation factor Elf1
MEIDDAMGEWIQQPKRKSIKVTRKLSKGYKCESCETVLTTKDELSKHAVVHRKNKSFACEICGISFLNKKYEQVHRTMPINMIHAKLFSWKRMI